MRLGIAVALIQQIKKQKYRNVELFSPAHTANGLFPPPSPNSAIQRYKTLKNKKRNTKSQNIFEFLLPASSPSSWAGRSHHICKYMLPFMYSPLLPPCFSADLWKRSGDYLSSSYPCKKSPLSRDSHWTCLIHPEVVDACIYLAVLSHKLKLLLWDFNIHTLTVIRLCCCCCCMFLTGKQKEHSFNLTAPQRGKLIRIVSTLKTSKLG